MNKNYKIRITETLSEIIDIEAESPEEAIAIAKMIYDNGEIVLDYDMFNSVDIKLIQPDEN